MTPAILHASITQYIIVKVTQYSFHARPPARSINRSRAVALRNTRSGRYRSIGSSTGPINN